MEYDKGSFDEWCVYLTRPGASRTPPKDADYFQRLNHYSLDHSPEFLYNDFVRIYNATTKTLDKSMFDTIVNMCQKYGKDSTDISVDLSIIYMGMVAEENKEHTMLGKRVKRLGVHQVLVDGMDPELAANFSKKLKWREIDNICKTKGF